LFILDTGAQIKQEGAGMDEVTTILAELAIARVTLRAGLPGQSITIEQAQHLIGQSHEHVVTAIALLRSDKSVSPPANDREAGNLSSRSREEEKRNASTMKRKRAPRGGPGAIRRSTLA
jgi:hypothetical protein